MNSECEKSQWCVFVTFHESTKRVKAADFLFFVNVPLMINTENAKMSW